MNGLEFWMLPLLCLMGVLLDAWWGELSTYHPLVGFGNLASSLGKVIHQRFSTASYSFQQLSGAVSWCLLVLPLPLFLLMLPLPWWADALVGVICLYFSLGLRSLKQHAMKVYWPLKADNLPQARQFTGYLVSRDTRIMNEAQISRACVESVLENANDSVIASLFWFAVGGAPAVVLHRLVNTLDAMWGYRNERYLHFGRWAARADDIMALPSAIITSILCLIWMICQRGLALLMSGLLAEHSKPSPLPKDIQSWVHNVWRQALAYKSFNGGLSMASGAWVLGIRLGGPAIYDGKTLEGSYLGPEQGNSVTPTDILFSCQWLNQLTGLMLMMILLLWGALWLIT